MVTVPAFQAHLQSEYFFCFPKTFCRRSLHFPICDQSGRRETNGPDLTKNLHEFFGILDPTLKVVKIDSVVKMLH